MNQLTPSILIADDDMDVLSALKLALKNEPINVTTANNPHQVLTILARKRFSCVLIDLNYTQDTTSGSEGASLIKAIKDIDKDLPIIAMTGYGNIHLAVEMMKLGASDFIEKPWRNVQLISSIKQQVKHIDTIRNNQRLSQENSLLAKNAPIQVIAKSAKMLEVLEQIKRISISDMNVLLTGENGTGKSMLAKYLHQHSARKNHSFLSVNMGAISDTLFESEMFGHTKGAFTDAKEDRIGRFELAEKGTLFLDEIANIHLNQQAKLLHVLEERQFERVGCNITLNANVRLVSATNSNLPKMIEENKFREDLMYRLNTVEIRIPALKERTEDIIPLAKYFIGKLIEKYGMSEKTLSNNAIEHLLNYPWPGNIRELHHTIERALFLSTHEVISAEDLNLPSTGTMTATHEEKHQTKEKTLEEIERSIIIERLNLYNFDPHKTAESLGLSRSSYYRRLEKHQLNA